jgi:hypothetical protein
MISFMRSSVGLRFAIPGEAWVSNFRQAVANFRKHWTGSGRINGESREDGMGEIKRCQMLIDGEWVGASDGAVFASVSPVTGAVWAEVPEATAADVDRAVRAADRALSGPWAAMTPSARGKCLRKLGDLLAEASEELGRAETLDTGKMLKETRWQAKYIAEFFHFYAGAADKIAGEVLPIGTRSCFCRR